MRNGLVAVEKGEILPDGNTGMGHWKKVSVCSLKLFEGCWRTNAQTFLGQGVEQLNNPDILIRKVRMNRSQSSSSSTSASCCVILAV